MALKNLVTIKKESIFFRNLAPSSFLPPPNNSLFPKGNIFFPAPMLQKNKGGKRINGNKGIGLPNIVRKIDFEQKESATRSKALSEMKNKVRKKYSFICVKILKIAYTLFFILCISIKLY